MSCLSLLGDPSAVNQSWVCLKREVISKNRGHTSTTDADCYFLYFQQFSRSSESCGWMEVSVVFCLFICCVVCNTLNFTKCYAKQFKAEFLLLLAVFNISNVALTFHGVIAGIARLTDDWLFGEFGCIAIFESWMILLTISCWTLTLISYERRTCVCDPPEPSAQSVFGGSTEEEPCQFNWRLFRFSLMTISLNAVICAAWSYPFLYRHIADTQPFYISGVKEGTEPVTICTTFVRSNLRFGADLLYFISIFAIPISLEMYNYWKVWRFVTIGGNVYKRREMRLASVTGLLNIPFIIFTLPFHVIAGYIATFDRYHSQTSQSAFYFWATMLIHLRAIVIPLQMNYCLNGCGIGSTMPRPTPPRRRRAKSVVVANGANKMSSMELNHYHHHNLLDNKISAAFNTSISSGASSHRLISITERDSPQHNA